MVKIIVAVVFMLSFVTTSYHLSYGEDEWPTLPPQGECDLQLFGSHSGYWGGCAWRENGNVYFFVVPDEDNPHASIYSWYFHIVQDGIQYNDPCLTTQTSGSFDCSPGIIIVPTVVKVTLSGDGFEKYNAFDLYHDTSNSPMILDDAPVYYLDIIVSPPEASNVDPEDIGYYHEGETIWVYLYANSGYKFVSWSDFGDSDGYRSIDMPGEDLTLTAYFEESQTSSNGDSGSDSSSGCFVQALMFFE